MRVSITLRIDAFKKSSDVSSLLNSSPAGKVFEISSRVLLISALTCVALAPGAWLIMNIVPGCPSISVRKSYDLVPSSTFATSDSLRISPSGVARTMICSNSLISLSRPRNSMSILSIEFSNLPIGETRFCSLMA